jgi:hypothetical protein
LLFSYSKWHDHMNAVCACICMWASRQDIVLLFPSLHILLACYDRPLISYVVYACNLLIHNSHHTFLCQHHTHQHAGCGAIIIQFTFAALQDVLWCVWFCGKKAKRMKIKIIKIDGWTWTNFSPNSSICFCNLFPSIFFLISFKLNKALRNSYHLLLLKCRNAFGTFLWFLD